MELGKSSHKANGSLWSSDSKGHWQRRAAQERPNGLSEGGNFNDVSCCLLKQLGHNARADESSRIRRKVA